MTLSNQRGEVQNFLDLLLYHNLAIWTNQVVIHHLARNKARVSWPSSHMGDVGALFHDESITIDQYKVWLDSGALSAVLFDGSILQISFDFKRDELVGHRLSYYPCPFELGDEGRMLLETYPILDVFELFEADYRKHVRLRSPIRFDYDPDSVGEDHPSSHITLNSDDCRMPVRGPLSLGHFIEFIFRNFYQEKWREYAFLRELPRGDSERTIKPHEESRLHLSWNIDGGIAGVAAAA